MRRKFKQAALEKVLRELCKQANLRTVAIASGNGLLVCSAGPEAELLAAVAANLSTSVLRLPQLDPPEEIVIRSGNGHQLVCRHFSSRGDALILIALLKAGGPYRRHLGAAIRRLQTVWETPLA